MALIQFKDQFRIGNIDTVTNKLPKGNYLLSFDQNSGEYFLTQKEEFVLPKKIYGSSTHIDRWIISYKNNTEKNLGISLEGFKGSGKTIDAQKFCILLGLPVIMITEPYEGSAFINFITNPVFNNCIIFIDEFEKVYSETGSEKWLLSLMDGQYPTRYVFVLTSNIASENPYLINRLNRIKYRKVYDSLDLDIIDEVINDLLVYPEFKESILKFFKYTKLITFDLLVNLIKEINLFKEDALVCGNHLNIIPETMNYDVFLEHNDNLYPQPKVFNFDDNRFILNINDNEFLSKELKLISYIRCNDTTRHCFIIKHNFNSIEIELNLESYINKVGFEACNFTDNNYETQFKDLVKASENKTFKFVLYPSKKSINLLNIL